jgi:hypothetical protein
MPTPRKNNPSRRPRNGSISASSWWRNEDSESSTPARNAPIAIDSPPSCMANAEPSTTSSAAAVITSRARAPASRLNMGLSSQRPTAISATIAPSPTATDVRRAAIVTSAPPGARNATSASSGTIARSSSRSTETMRWPFGVDISPRSSSTCITIAVEVRTKPAAATNEMPSGKPSARPTHDSNALHAPTCNRPSPKISRRRLHRREGSISSPIMNRNMTTPSSATCRMACGSANNPRPNGPITSPAAR